MNSTYGIGGALQDIGGNIMQMAFSNMKDKKLEERRKQAEEAQRILEEKRVARVSKPYVQKGDPKAYSPWMSQESKGYAAPTGTPDQLMVSEYNSQGRPIGSRLADPGEKQGYEQEQLLLAKANAAAKAKEDAALRKEDRESRKLASQLETDKARRAQAYAGAESSRAYAKNLASPNAKGPDTFKDESDLAYLVSAKEGGDALDAEYKQQLAVAMADARALGADESKLRAVMQELTREYILRAKRLPKKTQE